MLTFLWKVLKQGNPGTLAPKLMRFINWAPSNETLCSAAESESEMKANKLDSLSAQKRKGGGRVERGKACGFLAEPHLLKVS